MFLAHPSLLWTLSALGIALAVALPVIVWWKLRNPDDKRQAMLEANAQPRLTVAMRVVACIALLVSGLGCALAAIAFPVLWVGVAACAGGLVSLIIVMRAARWR